MISDSKIFYLNPRYILFIHLVVNDMIQLTSSVSLFVFTYIFYQINVAFCCSLITLAIFTTQNNPLTLAVMAVECHIAICFPLQHSQICTVKNVTIVITVIWGLSSLTILPNLFTSLATESRDFFHSRVFCLRKKTFRPPELEKKKNISNIVFLVIVWLTLVYTYFRILFAAQAAAANARKARNTVLLHGFQLLLCMLNYVYDLLLNGLTSLFPKGVLTIRYTISVFVHILPRLVSPLVYGIRDKAFRRYLRKYLFYSPKANVNKS
ncbi:odorant receptor 131-2-like [Neolamprologus brichardi]|uniref:odorant receptor 131-2-like n=1 Tax=Neolamprologus brichardi TaxID=32507 RepID=UPI0003EC4BDF|nr:odorant receptor 131-2-like [Neolamprologus brichardi]